MVGRHSGRTSVRSERSSVTCFPWTFTTFETNSTDLVQSPPECMRCFENVPAASSRSSSRMKLPGEMPEVEDTVRTLSPRRAVAATVATCPPEYCPWSHTTPPHHDHPDGPPHVPLP